MYKRKRKNTSLIRELDDSLEHLVNNSTPSEELVFLKEAIINDTDIELIKNKLNSTRTFRKEIMKDMKFDIRESLPFFLSHPILVMKF